MNIYQEALLAQQSMRLSSVVMSFAACLDEIWCEVRLVGGDEKDVHEHPVAILYAHKIAELTGLVFDDNTVFLNALRVYQEAAARREELLRSAFRRVAVEQQRPKARRPSFGRDTPLAS